MTEILKNAKNACTVCNLGYVSVTMIV